jgi:hypothetical protein
MTEWDSLLARFASRGLLIDTNILLLYFVGNHDRSLISRFKRTNNFIESDYELLLALLSCVRLVVTTPHILPKSAIWPDSSLIPRERGCSKTWRVELINLMNAPCQPARLLKIKRFRDSV